MNALAVLSGVLLVQLALGSLPFRAEGSATPTAVEIAENVEFVNRFRGVRNLSYGTGDGRLILVDRPAGASPRINALQRFRNNDYEGGEIASQDLVIFRAGKLRGTGILMTDYRDGDRSASYSIWLPAMRKIRRFAEPDPADSWGGSNFTYGDIYLRRARDEHHELLGLEPFPGCLGVMEIPPEQAGRQLDWLPSGRCEVAGRETFKLKSRPRVFNPDYDHRIVWIDRETFADYRSEFFKDEKPWKRIDKDWRTLGLEDPRAQLWVYWYALTHVDGHEGMAFINPAAVAWNTELDPRLFTESRLRRIKR